MIYESFIPTLGNESLYTALFAALPGKSILVKADAPRFTMVAATPEYIVHSGYAKKPLVGQGVFEAFPPNNSDPDHKGDLTLLASFQHVLQHKEPQLLPLQRYDLQAEDGNFIEKYWKVSNNPVFGTSGEIAYIIHTAEDITDQVKARKTEQAHRELQAAYQKIMESQTALQKAHEYTVDILESTTDAFYALDAGFNFTYVNKRAARLWGRNRDGLIGKHYWTEFPTAVGSESYEKHYEALKEGKPIRYEAWSPLLGMWIEAEIYPVGDGGLSVFFHDITERKRIEEAVRTSEERLQKVISIETVGVIYFDLEGVIHDANAAFEQMSGWRKEQLVSGSVRWDELTPPEFMEATLKSRDEFLTKGQNTPYEKQYIRPDGSCWWGLFAGKRLSEKECVEFVVDITKAKDLEGDLERKVQERTSQLEKANGELKRSNAQLEEFAHAASHDLKEPVRKIHFFTNQLKGQLSKRLEEGELQLFNRIENATERMGDLIDDLLLYSHVSHRPHEMEGIDLNLKVQRALEDLELDIAEKKAVIHVEKLPTVSGYRRQLQQLFQNLISNALKYSKKDVPPRIDITASEVIENDRHYHLIAVKDNGIGFDPEYADKIFQMFTRLHGKGEYSGTGVGLSIVKKVVENHNGHIRVESTSELGSTFMVLLPVE